MKRETIFARLAVSAVAVPLAVALVAPSEAGDCPIEECRSVATYQNRWVFNHAKDTALSPAHVKSGTGGVALSVYKTEGNCFALVSIVGALVRPSTIRLQAGEHSGKHQVVSLELFGAPGTWLMTDGGIAIPHLKSGSSAQVAIPDFGVYWIPLKGSRAAISAIGC